MLTGKFKLSWNHLVVISLILALLTIFMCFQNWVLIDEELTDQLSLITSIPGIFPGVGSITSVILLLISVLIISISFKFKEAVIPTLLVAIISYLNFILVILDQSLLKALLKSEEVNIYLHETLFPVATAFIFTGYILLLCYLTYVFIIGLRSH